MTKCVLCGSHLEGKHNISAEIKLCIRAENYAINGRKDMSLSTYRQLKDAVNVRIINLRRILSAKQPNLRR